MRRERGVCCEQERKLCDNVTVQELSSSVMQIRNTIARSITTQFTYHRWLARDVEFEHFNRKFITNFFVGLHVSAFFIDKFEGVLVFLY